MYKKKTLPGELWAAVEMCNGCGAYDETLSQSLRVCCTDQLLLGWDLLKYLTATLDQFLHAYRWAQTSWIRFLQMACRLCGRSLKISQTGFPISNNQPLPVPPSVGQVLIFKQKHRCALAEVTPHSVTAEWTQFPFHRCQCLQMQSEALSSSELLNVDNFAKK